VTDATSCDDTGCETLVSPMPTATPRDLEVRVRPRERRVLLVDSTKTHSDAILFRVRDALEARHIPVDEILRKRRASQVMDDAQLDHVAGYGGLVLCAVND